jgi:hypothetical protein
MKKWLALPLALVSCAPALIAVPKPLPGQVIVQAVSNSGVASNLSSESEAGIAGFASLSALLIVQSKYRTGLPSTYDNFTFPRGSESMTILSPKNDPIAIAIDWRATEKNGKNTVDVHWESRPMGGKLLSVQVKAKSTDSNVNTRSIEDALLERFYKFEGITFLASGR